MFVEEADRAIFVLATSDAHLVPGDRIRVRGTTRAGLRPYIASSDIALVGHGHLPPPRPAGFADLIASVDDCMRVTVRGRVRAAVEEVQSDVRGSNRPHQAAVHMQVLADGGIIDALIDQGDGRSLDPFLDADVEITGIAGGKFDGKWEQTGVVIHVSSLADIKVLHRAMVDPWSIRNTAMNEIMRSYQVHDLSSRVRVHGTVTYYQPGTAVVLQDGSRSLWVSTLSRTRFEPGEVVDAVGFPDTHTGFLMLNDAVVRDLNRRAPLSPEAVRWSELVASQKIFDLVTIQGQVVTANRETGQDQYVISTSGHLFTAIFRHNTLFRFPDEPMPPLKQVEPGSTVRVTGVCIPQDSNPFVGQVPFNILLRSPEGISMVARPPWLTVRHLVMLVGVLVLAVFVLGVRAWLVERRSRRQIVSMAYVEQRRARILEHINATRPLAEILENITELVSARLRGAPCWCQVIDGARLGNRPPRLPSPSLRVVELPIPARSGASLGSIYAAFDARTRPRPAETEGLAMGASLATLAIETSHLYSDLVHRSEYDLLTDVQNRFSLEKFLDEQIQAARQSAGIFGLLYADLDRFKQVNDVYGHHVGDVYLQEAAKRMKRQLRPGDVLARLGGDEFAVVVPAAHHRANVEEIAHRLERCFDEPFRIEGHVLHGSVSIGIALYPEAGADRDTLLNAADAAMYRNKNSREAGVESSR